VTCAWKEDEEMAWHMTGWWPPYAVADIARCQFQPVKDAGGNQAQVVNAPENYGVAEVFDLARADGSRWSDPDMRTWQSLGFGQLASFNWSA
jgi:hypothetical protein